MTVAIDGGIAMITSGFPRVSETFALNELLALERAGALGAIFATKPGDGHAPQPGAETLAGRVEVLSDPRPGAQVARVVERMRGARVRAVHAYFAHAPAAVAERAAAVLGVPFSFSAHARDIRKVPRGELTRRARAAACVVACNTDVADDLGATGARVELIPHGVDLRRFAPTLPPRGEPLELLAVGRLVEKKGLGALLEAVAGLEAPFRLRIVGDGPLRGALERAIVDAGLRDRATLDGTLTHRELPGAYAGANVVVVPSIQDADGDRDGLPNVVLEAMASARPVVASEVAAIPAAVRDGDTGLLVPPGDPRALRAALDRLARDPALRAGIGVAARRRVERDFELGRCTRRLLDCLRDAYA